MKKTATLQEKRNQIMIGLNIKERRRLLDNMTQEELSTDSNVSLATVKRYETGEGGNDNLKMGRIAIVLKSSIEKLNKGVVHEMDEILVN